MDAEIITVGQEIVLGEIDNTNARFLADRLRQQGLIARWQTTTDDDPQHISAAVKTALSRVKTIFVCGGLGPTADDNTLAATAAALGTHLAIDEPHWRWIKQEFANRHQAIVKSNIVQACFLAGGQSLTNPVGLAVGSCWQQGEKTVVVLPGPPREFRAMIDQEVLPRLQKLLPDQQLVADLTMHYVSVPESQLMATINAALKNNSAVVATSYVQPGEIQVRLTMVAASQQEADDQLQAARQVILAAQPQGYFGDGQITLVGEVVRLLTQKHLHVTAAESLTGGLLQSLLCSVPGASTVFDGGFVTYSPAQKATMLGIQKEVIAKYGVVSSETAGAMADGCRQKVGADFGLGLTGVAGPDELEGQPAGTVWLGLSAQGEPTRTRCLHLPAHSGRQAIRLKSVQAALMMLYQHLQK